MKTTFYVFLTLAGLTAVLLGLGRLFSSRNNIHEKTEWGAIFKAHGIDSATFEIIEQSKERAFFYNIGLGSRRAIPASTFKVFLSLVALETGVAPNEDMIIPYNGKPSGNKLWDSSINMSYALEVSSEPYYRELAKRIGKSEIKRWADSVKYGNMVINDPIEDCWHNGTLLITPDEQVGFVKKLYFDELPFSKRAQRIVRTMMLRETGEKYKLYHKTGTHVKDGLVSSWVVGYVEDSTNHPYFFSNYYQTKDTNIEKLRKERIDIVKEVFGTMGIMRK
ncbi:MAG: class beta-lactamase [Bacteroidota bacterium]|jgi:beta-lactamase class D